MVLLQTKKSISYWYWWFRIVGQQVIKTLPRMPILSYSYYSIIKVKSNSFTSTFPFFLQEKLIAFQGVKKGTSSVPLILVEIVGYGTL